jgi:DNA recombination protein RmuC
MGKLLKEFNEQNKSLIDQAQQGYQDSAKDRAVLAKHIDLMAQQTQAVSKETNSLAEALRGDVRTQGHWGEAKLERMLEESGLENGREYVTQKTYINKNGERRRPDAVVTLPEGKHVVIDSKVSLKNYQDYYGTDDQDLKDEHKATHVASIRKHITELSKKDYATVEGINAFEYIIMFCPIEPALQLALEADRKLIQFAYEKKILLVSPLSLIQALRIFVHLWRTQKQTENVRLIAKLGGQIYDQFVLYMDAFLDVGNKLEQARGSYKKAQNRLTEGRGNVTGRLEKLKALGAKTNKQIPSTILDEAARNDESTSIITTPH